MGGRVGREGPGRGWRGGGSSWWSAAARAPPLSPSPPTQYCVMDTLCSLTGHISQLPTPPRRPPLRSLLRLLLQVRPSDLDRFAIPEQCRLAMTEEDVKTGRKLVGGYGGGGGGWGWGGGCGCECG